jgi:PhnB protein
MQVSGDVNNHMPAAPENPPIAEKDKRLVMHVELPILGGHLLMGSDAPESMGFKVNLGNNVQINLEPDTKTETRRLFQALSAGGKVTMELQDTFWGAFYGTPLGLRMNCERVDYSFTAWRPKMAA